MIISTATPLNRRDTDTLVRVVTYNHGLDPTDLTGNVVLYHRIEHKHAFVSIIWPERAEASQLTKQFAFQSRV